MATSSTTFRPGPDPRRHVFTREEQQRGYAAMLATPMPARLRAAIRNKIKRYFRGKPNRHVQMAVEAHRKIYGESA